MNTISNLPKHLYHYTTLEGLKGIISSNALWATHYKYLNDSSEVDYARSIISEALADTIEKRIAERQKRSLRTRMEVSRLGGRRVVAKAEADNLISTVYKSTFSKDKNLYPFAEPFITSFCSHEDDDHTDREYKLANGLLSQWRAYGRKDGCAIVFDAERVERLLRDEGGRYRYSQLVIRRALYDAKSIINRYSTLVDQLADIYTKRDTPDFYPQFTELVTSLKHLGFREENEIRIIAIPIRKEIDVRAKIIQRDFTEHNQSYKEIKIRGTTNTPYIELFTGCSILLSCVVKVIIGPSPEQQNVFDIVTKILEEPDIVVRSETPYVGQSSG